MIDRGKVIKGLLCIKGDFVPCASCKYATAEGYGRGDRCKRQCASDALAMLKEQPEIVRCKDCKHYKDGFCYNPNTFDDEKTCGNTTPDWYCADGKRADMK